MKFTKSVIASIAAAQGASAFVARNHPVLRAKTLLVAPSSSLARSIGMRTSSLPVATDPTTSIDVVDSSALEDEIANAVLGSSGLVTANNYIAGKVAPPSSDAYLDVLDPSTSSPVGRVALSSASDVDDAVSAARSAFPSWSGMTVKARAAIMLKFHALVREHAQELAELIVKENGKNLAEALAEVAKGNETVEYACSLPQLMQGKMLDVSSGGVTCRDRRDPLGVVASVVPFNFPFMIPHWSIPIALVAGNTVVLKPSEKVPLTMRRVVELYEEAGVPEGVINLVNGEREVVEALIDHDGVDAVTFVGSSPVAKIVHERAGALNKRCTALGGAKNHLIALPDCDVQGTALDVVISCFGCAGQRCMASSVLLLVGDEDDTRQQELLDAILEKAGAIESGTGRGQMGPLIDEASARKVKGYIQQSEEGGAEVLLDGRGWNTEMADTGGNWIGPTVVLHKDREDRTMNEEVFGPVLSVYRVGSWQEAIEIENESPFGNAAAVYTTNGGSAEWFMKRVRASMLGVNVGIPVPREPFSFGGLYGTRSKYGDMDITGDGGMEFFTNRIKITSRWPAPAAPEYASGSERDGEGGGDGKGGGGGGVDHANFAGRM